MTKEFQESKNDSSEKIKFEKKNSSEFVLFFNYLQQDFL